MPFIILNKNVIRDKLPVDWQCYNVNMFIKF